MAGRDPSLSMIRIRRARRRRCASRSSFPGISGRRTRRTGRTTRRQRVQALASTLLALQQNFGGDAFGLDHESRRVVRARPSGAATLDIVVADPVFFWKRRAPCHRNSRVYKPVLGQAWFLEVAHASPRWVGAQITSPAQGEC